MFYTNKAVQVTEMVKTKLTSGQKVRFTLQSSYVVTVYNFNVLSHARGVLVLQNLEQPTNVVVMKNLETFVGNPSSVKLKSFDLVKGKDVYPIMFDDEGGKRPFFFKKEVTKYEFQPIPVEVGMEFQVNLTGVENYKDCEVVMVTDTQLVMKMDKTTSWHHDKNTRLIFPSQLILIDPTMTGKCDAVLLDIDVEVEGMTWKKEFLLNEEKG